MEVGYVIGLNMGVMWILPNLVDYEKFHLWPWEVGSINYVNKWLYGSILRAYVKRNIESWIRSIMELFCAFRAKIRSFKEETNVIGLQWGIYFN